MWPNEIYCVTPGKNENPIWAKVGKSLRFTLLAIKLNLAFHEVRMPFGRSMLALLLVASALVQAADPKPDENAERTRRLIQQLGSESYTERDQAIRELSAMGAAAVEALEFAARGEDPEVRNQASRLLARLRTRDLIQELGSDSF